MDFSVKDTTAYKIVRQMVDHIWGSDQELSEIQFAAVCRLFKIRGNDWKDLMDGSMDTAVRLEECIEAVIKYEKTMKTAFAVASKFGRVR